MEQPVPPADQQAVIWQGQQGPHLIRRVGRESGQRHERFPILQQNTATGRACDQGTLRADHQAVHPRVGSGGGKLHHLDPSSLMVHQLPAGTHPEAAIGHRAQGVHLGVRQAFLQGVVVEHDAIETAGATQGAEPEVTAGVLGHAAYLALGQSVLRGMPKEHVLLGRSRMDREQQRQNDRSPVHDPAQKVLIMARNSGRRRRETGTMAPVSSTAMLPSDRLNPVRCSRFTMYDLCTR